jgi:predicted nucleic acid-binding protein
VLKRADSVRHLLDTSALLAHYRQEAGWQEVQALFESDTAEIIIASVSLTEFGRRLRALGATAEQTEQTLANYELLFDSVASVDVAAAFAALAISNHTPQRLPLVDALIAGTAQVKQAVLVHRDEHMRAIPGELLPQIDLGSLPSPLSD